MFPKMSVHLMIVGCFWFLAAASAPEDAINVSFSLNDLKHSRGRNTVETVNPNQVDDIAGTDDSEVQEEPELEPIEDEDLEDLLVEAEEGTKRTESPELSRCCTRERKLQAIGFQVNGEMHYVDVGHCRRTCKIPRLTHTTSHRERSNTRRPYGVNTLSQESSSSRSCSTGYHCEPVLLRRDTHHLLSGPTAVSVVSSCSCLPRRVRCQRLSQRLTVFPDSPYEADVDVGLCRGRCSSGEESCRPSRNRTVSVDGPNGAICINVIDECSCRSSCYRMQTTEVHYDWTWDELTNSTQQRIKEIDVGRCVGECAAGGLHRCLLRDPSDSSICKMALQQRPASCGPKAFHTHRLTTAHDQEKAVLAITECGCM